MPWRMYARSGNRSTERNIRFIREGRQARGEPIPFEAQVEQALKTKSRSRIDPALRTIRRECRARVRRARTTEAPFPNISAASGEDASEDTAQQIALTKFQKYCRLRLEIWLSEAPRNGRL